MKNIIGFPAAWVLWFIGHLISIPMCAYECCSCLYPAYNKLMAISSDIQDWAGCSGPWENIEQ